jgi:hypothetical protein
MAACKACTDLGRLDLHLRRSILLHLLVRMLNLPTLRFCLLDLLLLPLAAFESRLHVGLERGLTCRRVRLCSGTCGHSRASLFCLPTAQGNEQSLVYCTSSNLVYRLGRPLVPTSMPECGGGAAYLRTTASRSCWLPPELKRVCYACLCRPAYSRLTQ